MSVCILISSKPIGANIILVDEEKVATPTEFDWDPGEEHTLTALLPIKDGPECEEWVWERWSDGGDISHIYTVPEEDDIVVALYKCKKPRILDVCLECGALFDANENYCPLGLQHCGFCCNCLWQEDREFKPFPKP